MRRSVVRAAYLAATLAGSLLIGCEAERPAEGCAAASQVRAASSGGRVAVLFRVDCPTAGTPSVFSVVRDPVGDGPSAARAWWLLLMDAEGIRLRWKDETTLLVCAQRATLLGRTSDPRVQWEVPCPANF